jgi:hypothetical protein
MAKSVLIKRLPNELCDIVIRYLNTSDFYRFLHVSKAWKNFINSDDQTSERMFRFPPKTQKKTELGANQDYVAALWQAAFGEQDDMNDPGDRVEATPLIGGSDLAATWPWIFGVDVLTLLARTGTKQRIHIDDEEQGYEETTDDTEDIDLKISWRDTWVIFAPVVQVHVTL